jgi:hypothetical protein
MYRLFLLQEEGPDKVVLLQEEGQYVLGRISIQAKCLENPPLFDVLLQSATKNFVQHYERTLNFTSIK